MSCPSPVTRHPSPVTRHPSPVTRHLPVLTSSQAGPLLKRLLRQPVTLQPQPAEIFRNRFARKLIHV